MNVYDIRRPGFEAPPDQNCWFIKVEETKQSNKSRVLSPFSQHPIKNMPASFPKELPHLSQILKALTVSSTQKLRRFSSFGKEWGMLLIGCRENGLNTLNYFGCLDNYHGSGVALVKREISEAEEPKLSRSYKRPGNEEHGGENRHVKKYRRRDLLEVETNKIVDDKQPFLLRRREL
ncbi:hypothetical protein V6N13_117882 [Hibiscus sabdariffa]|uniref:Uncharacterized protein n=1 Tax=Hibiscus sabdariffa TaxID=183260 RepID=A0ABR2Q9H7_9ROSI